ncbi:2-oxoacid:acceptor oxidoreductase subunit alpha [Methanocalculus taiwanensis]|uniref:2-oxoacid:acceptor oxidoreductase subunit alpha n=1 Tax=Methanocalculus taiwanensis TaxID=106207 RepID=A0ABD4TL16_9EURY|nr:2-oxoacid:acceptor oxidoreductase subunit alpha [Methanocalculus taiwanensis]MCQ1538005.1 2-oxoacid:acceptor oxidoreductase subunit alpha [Methanocalculus taiwanensis]
MNDYSICIGGQAGEGINKAGLLIGRVLGLLGYHLYMYYDYPSLIRGGHNFAILRAAEDTIGAIQGKPEIVCALDQETVNRHGNGSLLIYDSDDCKGEGIGIPATTIIREEGGAPIARNTVLIGAFCRAAGIPPEILKEAIQKEFGGRADENQRLALRGYHAAEERMQIPIRTHDPLPMLAGNDAIALGLIRGGLDAYVSYPMTPSSSILHTMADLAQNTPVLVIHPENEIAVITMALGLSYAGKRVAVGTSGGGFCLMTEGVSLAGMAEQPVVIVMAMRPGPSTGMPTYSSQGDLGFVLHAGHGEFPRIVIAPGTTEEAYEWSARAVHLAWQFQVPVFVLSDKNLGEHPKSTSIDPAFAVPIASIRSPRGTYARYCNMPDGISFFYPPPLSGNVVKVNSYTHDDVGITTEDPDLAAASAVKQIRKGATIENEMAYYGCLRVDGREDAPVALICFGSTGEACREIGERLSLKVIRPIVLAPFPLAQFSDALAGVERMIVVEENATGQLDSLLRGYGIVSDRRIANVSGRPFFLDELELKVRGVMQ